MVDTGRSIREVEMYLAGLSYREVVLDSAPVRTLSPDPRIAIAICFTPIIEIHSRKDLFRLFSRRVTRFSLDNNYLAIIAINEINN